MKKVLKSTDKVLYSDGDEKYGSELVLVAKRTTTPASDNAPKIVHCVKYKTLCDALRELAEYEQKEGTEKFVKGILDRDKLIRGELVINHHFIVGGGDSKDPTVEDTEFKDPRLPYFVDIEYIEVGYAMSKQWIHPNLAYAFWTFIGKPLGRVAEGQKQRWPVGDYNNRPNRIGIKIGKMIANEYKSIANFVEKFCVNECGNSQEINDDLQNVKYELY